MRGIDKALQTALLDAAKKAEERGWKMSLAETDAKLKILRDNKMSVSEPSDALKKGLRAIGEKMTAEWRKSAGADGEAILKAYKK